MSTTFTASINTEQHGVPMHRLVDVELRKLIDTRAGFWLMLMIGVMVALIETILVITAIGYSELVPWSYMFTAMATPLGILLAVLGIMTVTSEWGQRTSLVTFSLEPRRMRIVIAKLLAGLLATVILLLFTIVLTAGLNAIQAAAIGEPAMWDMTRKNLLVFALVNTTGFLLGFSFGMLIPNTPAAIVAFFAFRYVIPGMLLIMGALWEWFAPVVDWINLQDSLTRFADGGMTQDEWFHLASSFGVWVVLPLVLGSFLLLRREIK